MFKMLGTDTTNKRKGKPVCVLRGWGGEPGAGGQEKLFPRNRK